METAPKATGSAYQYHAEDFSFEEFYSIPEILAKIASPSIRNIVIQFPIDQLEDAGKLQEILAKEFPQKEFYHLADTYCFAFPDLSLVTCC